jgi:hypothetical protein
MQKGPDKAATLKGFCTLHSFCFGDTNFRLLAPHVNFGGGETRADGRICESAAILGSNSGAISRELGIEKI